METLKIIINKKYQLFFIGLILFGTIFFAIYKNKNKGVFSGKEFSFPNSQENKKRIINESNTMKSGKDVNWWLNSGGIMNVSQNEFSTNLGDLPESSKWRKLYKKNNSRDTDSGYHPQNIFRLVTKDKWKNFSQSVYFYIEDDNLSKSSYRNESNGILLFNRYQDGDNLYYTGLRVDGDVIIKKKIEGKYYTMIEKGVLPKEKKYDRTKNPNLIPKQKWIGIKSEFTNSWTGTVEIKLYLDLEGNGNWKLFAEATDSGKKYGKKTFSNEGYGGIRTDFMDVKFRDYKIIEK